MWLGILKEALTITIFVFIIMTLMDFIDAFSEQKLTSFLKGGRWRQYILAAFLGATPGCLGAFMVVSLYIHGQINLGALIGCMVATCGDEAFIMLAKIPEKAFLVMFLLFFLGIISAWIADKFFTFSSFASFAQCCPEKSFHVEFAEPVFNFNQLKKNFKQLSFHRFLLLILLCFTFFLFSAGRIGPKEWNWIRTTFIFLLLTSLFIAIFASEHYLEIHIWQHLIKGHLWRVFIWTLSIMVFIKIGLLYFNIDAFIRGHLTWVLLLSALVGLIPESGPHLVFVFLYAQNIIPFSVLLTSSIVQDGHGMLPLFSASIKISFWVKIFNFCFGILVGSIFYLFGY